MFKQPRIPEYRESEGTGKYLRSLVLFLKDFCMDCWVAVREIQKGGGGLLRALTSDPREDGEETDAPGFPGEEDTPGAALYREVIDYIYPIGRTITTFDDADNPNMLYPWQVWEQTAKGRMIIGTGANEANTDTIYGSLAAGTVDRTLGEMGGEAAHTLTQNELAKISGKIAVHGGEDGSNYWNAEGAFSTSPTIAKYKSVGSIVESASSITHMFFEAGGDQPHNNMPPYIAANIWKRVS